MSVDKPYHIVDNCAKIGDNFPQTVGNLANVKGVLIPPETLALKDALCWRTPGKHENVSGEP